MLEVDSVSVEKMVDRVSIAVRERERVGLAGLASSGKSELAEVIVGLRKPTEGRIMVRGKPLLAARVDFARGIGIAFVPEDRHANGFCSNLSVEENIALPILRRLSRWGFVLWRRRREIVSSLIERLQIKVTDPAQNAAELSGGNQQKTARRPRARPAFLTSTALSGACLRWPANSPRSGAEHDLYRVRCLVIGRISLNGGRGSILGALRSRGIISCIQPRISATYGAIILLSLILTRLTGNLPERLIPPL